MTALNIDEKVPLVLVVGFDGTEPALRALRSAADVLQQRPGRMDVVFVAHVPSTVALRGASHISGSARVWTPKSGTWPRWQTRSWGTPT